MLAERLIKIASILYNVLALRQATRFVAYWHGLRSVYHATPILLRQAMQLRRGLHIHSALVHQATGYAAHWHGIAAVCYASRSTLLRQATRPVAHYYTKLYDL